MTGSHVAIHPADPRYLAVAGRTWIPVGANASFVRAWTDSDEALSRQMGWIDRIAENGGNCARVWLSQPLLDPETTRAGIFAAGQGERLRALLDRARRRGVRLKLCLEHVRSIQPRSQAELFPGAAVFHKPLWDRAEGGPSADFADYLDGAAGRAHFLRRLEWFAAIAGDDAAVMGWELWNEIDAVSAGDWRGWTAAMLPAAAQRVRQPVMQSFGSLSEADSLATYRSAVALPGNRIAQVHRYLDPAAGLAVVRGPLDILAADAVAVLRDITGGDRPVLLSESGAVEAHHAGPSHLYARDVHGTILHDVLFAPFFAGACGPGHCWHWDHHYLDRHGLWGHLGRFAAAIAGIDPVAEGLRPERRDSAGLRGWQLAGARLVTAWLRDGQSDWRSELEQGRPAEPVSGARWTPGHDAAWLARARIRAYDPWTGRWCDLRAQDGEVPLPAFTRSLVVRAEAGA